MDQLILRKNRDLQQLNEDDWTIAGWRDRRALDDAGTHRKDGSNKDIGTIYALIGVFYFGALVVFMLVLLI